MMLESLSPLGASFAQPVALPDIEGIKLSERSDIGAVLVTTTMPGKDVAVTVGSALGCTLPLAHGKTTEENEKRAIWLSPRSWIILCTPAAESVLINAVTQTFPDYSVHVSRFSDALGWISLEGESAENLIRQGSFVTFDPAGLASEHAKRTLLAGIPAVILRETDTLWTIGVERSRTRFLVDWLSGLTQSVGENP